jgi:WhiB family redox-sensing transcriptional regulator
MERRAANPLTDLFDRPAWHLRAACLGVDPELFYPERGGNSVEPKKVCRGCPVREPCLEFAVTNNERYGIWGGVAARRYNEALRVKAAQAQASAEADDTIRHTSIGELVSAAAMDVIKEAAVDTQDIYVA